MKARTIRPTTVGRRTTSFVRLARSTSRMTISTSPSPRPSPRSTQDEIDLLPADAPDAYVIRQPGYWEALGADGITRLPAISGASLDQPYEPTDEDRAESSGTSTRPTTISRPRSPGLTTRSATGTAPRRSPTSAGCSGASEPHQAAYWPRWRRPPRGLSVPSSHHHESPREP